MQGHFENEMFFHDHEVKNMNFKTIPPISTFVLTTIFFHIPILTYKHEIRVVKS
jgi:hypothetical protein